MKTKTTGLKSIAFELEVSVNTVSRALRDCDDISKETKEKVRNKAIELGYLPSLTSQFIKKDENYLVAIILDNFNNGFFVTVASKIVNIASSNNLDYTFIYSQNKLGLDVIKQCISQRVDAIISLIEINEEIIDICKLNNIQIVSISKSVDSNEICEISTNNEKGAILASEFLFNEAKTNKFLYYGFDNVINSKLRENSFKNKLKELDENNLIKSFYANKEDIDNIFIYLSEGYKNIFCYNDELAYHLLKYLHKADNNFLVNNKDFNIVGYDALSLRNEGLIDINSIDYDYDEMCLKAINYLLLKFNKTNSNLPSKIIIDVKLHKGTLFLH